MTTTETAQKKYHEIIETLRTQRDDLKVKIHLANMEVRDEWEEVEDKWEHLKSREAQIGKEVGKSAHEVGEAISLLGQEIKEGYKRIRNAL